MAFLRNLIGSDLIRWWLAVRCKSDCMREFYRQDFPTLNTPWTEVEFLAIDLETTGLDANTDAIVSLGWVPVIGGAIHMEQAEHWLVQRDEAMPAASVVVHGIMDDHLTHAPPLEDGLKALLKALAGRIPIAHHARMEQTFLNKACQENFGCHLETPYVDTLALERHMFNKRGKVPQAGEMRLGKARTRYGLPRYRAHNALIDALSCAELFLAQAATQSNAKPVRLDELLV